MSVVVNTEQNLVLTIQNGEIFKNIIN